MLLEVRQADDKARENHHIVLYCNHELTIRYKHINELLR